MLFTPNHPNGLLDPMFIALALERPFLHAGRLVFHHPTDGRKMEFEAPLPHDLQLVLDQILPDEYERSTS